VTAPDWLGWNFMPTLMELASPLSGSAGTAESGNTEQGQTAAVTLIGTVTVVPMLSLSSSDRTRMFAAPVFVGVQL